MDLVHRRVFMAASAASAAMPYLAHAETPTASNVAWGTITRAARDAAYNNSQAVSDSAQLVDRWVAASATFRSQRPKHLDLAYGPAEWSKWDLFPSDNPSAPCLVFIHGGYWQMRSREDFSRFAEGVLARGWSAALPGYTLAPAATLTQIVSEVRSALDWLSAQGGAYGITGTVIISTSKKPIPRSRSGGRAAIALRDRPSFTSIRSPAGS